MSYRLKAFFLIWLVSLAVAYLVGTLGRELEPLALNERLRRISHRTPDPRIIMAGIDDEVFKKNLYNRKTHAQVLENLTQAGCRLVVFDIVFDENRDPADDARFAEAIEKAPAVVLAGTFGNAKEFARTPPKLAPSLEKVLKHGRADLGLIEQPQDEDGVFRRYSMAIEFEGQTYPSLSLAAYGLLQAVRSGDIQYQENSIEIPPDSIPITRQVSDVVISSFPLTFHKPATGPGHQPGEGTYPVVPYLQLLDPTPDLKQRLRGAIVYVGENTSGQDDVVTTPFGQMKGAEAHAQCLDSLIQKNYYNPAPQKLDLLVTVLTSGLIAILSLSQLYLPALLLVGALLTVGYVGINFYALEHLQILLNLTVPVSAALAGMASLVLLRLILASRFLSRFIPKEAVHGLLSSGQIAEAVQATVIVTDIRGYTSLSEARTPTEVLTLLNEYHSVTVDIYHKHGGNVLTFQGDAQLVVFGYPKRLKDPAGSAVQACVEVMRAIDALRTKWGITSRANFDVGVGICTGLVYIGDIGSKEQANYTVIGEVVRTSHKVQSMSNVLQGNVLMDQASFQACREKPHATAIPNVELEGFPDRKTLYRVEG